MRFSENLKPVEKIPRSEGMRAGAISFFSSRYDPLRWWAVGYLGFNGSAMPNE
jgi:hypothetical protein